MPAHEPVARGDEYLPPSEKRQVTGELGTFKAIAISAVIVLTQFVQPSTLNHGLRADFIYMIPFGAGVNGALAIGEDLGVPPNKATWTVAAYPFPMGVSSLTQVSLTLGAFVLMGGRVGACTVIRTWFWRPEYGGAFMVPNAIALLTIAFPPGRQRNITVGLFGAMAPIGAAGELSSTEPIVGSDEPYVYVLLIVSILHFAAFVVWEWRVANEPILPLDIWPAPSFSIMIVVAFAFFSFMSVGIVIWYISIRNLTIRHYTLFLNGAGYATLAVCGTVAAIASAKVIRYLPAQYIMAIGSVASCVALTLTATMPEQQTYWVQIFPALIFTAFGPDYSLRLHRL
ncbi:putative MFS-type transporter [Lipomyces tetrasporus]